MKQILFIIEDQLVAKNLANLFSNEDIKITLAYNGDLAARFAAKTEYDLIISDLQMKDESGIDVVGKINFQRINSIPFILITNSLDLNRDLISKAQNSGCKDIFMKPFDFEVLERVLSSILETPINDRKNSVGRSVVDGYEPPSDLKRFFYNALSSQWNPEKEIKWNSEVKIDTALCSAMAHILSPIIMGEYSAFNGIPRRILTFPSYEVKQYFAVQLVDETRHAEAFELYLKRIKAVDVYKKAWRNIKVVRYFNEMKKMQDNEEWITGLLVTEVTAHVLLQNYSIRTNCTLSQHLFRMIFTDESRHIGFVSYYLKEMYKNSSATDKSFLSSIVKHILELTGQMLEFYHEPLNAFKLDSKNLFQEITKEVENRVLDNVLRVPKLVEVYDKN